MLVKSWGFIVAGRRGTIASLIASLIARVANNGMNWNDLRAQSRERSSMHQACSSWFKDGFLERMLGSVGSIVETSGGHQIYAFLYADPSAKPRTYCLIKNDTGAAKQTGGLKGR